MKASVLVKLSLRSILRNRMRSLLTTLGIIIGVCSVIVMVAIGEGTQASIHDNIASMGTNLIMISPYRGPNSVNRLVVEDVEKIRREAVYVSAASGVVRGSGIAVGGVGSWSTTIYGVEPDYIIIKEWKIAEGDFFSGRDVSVRAKKAVIGSTIAGELFPGESPVGKRFRIANTPFEITGVLESKGASSMGGDQDDLIIVPLTTAMSRIRRSRNLQSIEVSAVSENRMDQAQAEVEEILRESHRLPPGAESDFSIFNQAEIIEMASSVARTLTMLLGAIAGVSLLVGGIGIMNIMLVSVTERTREIGIRLSVGARRRDIMRQFLTESVVLSLSGGVIGILFALGAVKILNSSGVLRAIVNPVFILISAGFAALVGIFFGYYPAQKASRMNPIDALRAD
ncbi:MAG: ABC transporter permease [Spirochaetales bacterium]|jgi:putative ABC transport system permease protein|nr:ABC transporter permease [Spirochaetales bacterium]